jgi:hypothetical protein
VAPGIPLVHVLDVVGREHYPNVADFVEEARRLGVSRHISKVVDFSLLGPGSMLYLLHARACLINHGAYLSAMARLWLRQPTEAFLHSCPKRREDHATVVNLADRSFTTPTECCAGLWWHDVEGGEWEPTGWLRVDRKVGDTRYQAWSTPPAVKPERAMGIFMAIPIARVAVIRANDDSHERLVDNLRGRTRLPVVVEDS